MGAWRGTFEEEGSAVLGGRRAEHFRLAARGGGTTLGTGPSSICFPAQSYTGPHASGGAVAGALTFAEETEVRVTLPRASFVEAAERWTWIDDDAGEGEFLNRPPVHTLWEIVHDWHRSFVTRPPPTAITGPKHL